MSLSSRFYCCLVIVLILVSPNASLDCSQYTAYQSCAAAKYCSWTQLRCVCDSPVNLDILFTISTSAYIGEHHFEYAIKPWLLEMTEVGLNDGVARVGWDIFSDTSHLTNISATTYNKMQTSISSMKYDAGAADLSQALMDAQEAFKYSLHTSQKLNVIVMGSNPYTARGKMAEVCQNASSIKQMGIEVVFIGIGSHWKEARIDCLVGDDTHIIRIDSYDTKDMNASLPIIYDFICPIHTSVKITEIKPVSTIKDTSHAPFVEFYNRGIQILSTDTLRLNGLMEGFIQGVTIAQGVYFVVYNANDGAVACDQTSNHYNLCKNAVYIACGSADHAECSWTETMSTTDWNIEIMDGNFDSLDSVQYNSDAYWSIVPADYSYELEYLGYHNKYGSNYVRSCTTQGSPGAHTFECSESELQCSLTEECTINGDKNAFCSDTTCICNDVGFYPKQGSCYRIPQPSHCTAYIVHNDTQKYTRFEFDGADTDMATEYGVRYYQKGLTDDDMITVIDVSRIRTENDLYIPVQTDATSTMTTAGYVYAQLTVVTPTQSTWISAKWRTNCTIITQTPTSSPTASPTMPPTASPTMSPTGAPTWQIPKVYLSGEFCDKDRCNCFDKALDCCVGTMAKDSDCSAKQLRYDLENDALVYQSIKIIPEVFPYPTLIHWRMRKIESSSDNQTMFGITVQPMYGAIWINDTTSSNVALVLNESNAFNETERDGVELSAMFVLELVNCSTVNKENMLSNCEVIYPSQVRMAVDRSDNAVVYGGGAEKIAMWIWIVLAGCALLLMLLGYLLYRYWHKGRKQSEDYQLLTDEIEFQKAYNDEDIETRVQQGDVSFNPLATGMPGSDKTHDPLTAEREKREIIQQSEVVEPMAEKEVFKSEMGQIQGRKTVTSNK